MLVFQTLVDTLGADRYLWMIAVLVMESAARHKHSTATEEHEWVCIVLISAGIVWTGKRCRILKIRERTSD